MFLLVVAMKIIPNKKTQALGGLALAFLYKTGGARQEKIGRRDLFFPLVDLGQA